jgi:hypothetical protein
MEVEGTLEGVRAYTIHGGPYYQLYYILPDDPETIRQCQLPADAVYEDPRPGAPLALAMLLQAGMRIGRRDPPVP